MPEYPKVISVNGQLVTLTSRTDESKYRLVSDGHPTSPSLMWQTVEAIAETKKRDEKEKKAAAHEGRLIPPR